MIRQIEGRFDGKGVRIALCASRFNSFIVERLIEGASDVLVRHGVEEKNLTLVKVPGAWELPPVVAKLCASAKYDAVVALGAVIRGGTPHFDYVAGEVSKGVAMVGMQAKIPVSFGVLTCDSLEQAIERAGSKGGNKGAEAALAALEMVNIYRALEAVK